MKGNNHFYAIPPTPPPAMKMAIINLEYGQPSIHFKWHAIPVVLMKKIAICAFHAA